MTRSAVEGVTACFSNGVESGLSIDVGPSGCDRMCVFSVDRSSVAGEILSDAADDSSSHEIPVLRDIRVPGWVDGDTYSVILSVTGESSDLRGLPERLSCRGSKVGCVTREGSLANDCRAIGADVVIIPDGIDVVGEVAFIAGALSRMIQSTGMFDAADMLSDAVSDAVRFFPPDAKDLAAVSDAVYGRVTAAYSTSDMHACSRWWKCVFAPSSLAFCGELPEFDHNELVGWSDPNSHSPALTMVVLRGCRGPGLVDDIVRCMIEVLEENGRRVLTIDLGRGSSMSRNIRGIIATSIIHRMTEGCI